MSDVDVFDEYVKLVGHIKERLVGLEDSLKASRVQRVELLTTIGLLREVVGVLWVVVRAEYDEVREEGHLPLATFPAVLEDVERRMAEINRRLEVSS